MGEAFLNNMLKLPIGLANGGTGAITAALARTNLELYKEYSLYSNASGTSSTITISDTYTNYNTIGVYFFSTSSNITGYQQFKPYATQGCTCGALYPSGDNSYMNGRGMLLSFSGTTLTFYRNYATQIDAEPTLVNEQMKVYRVVGYKY